MTKREPITPATRRELAARYGCKRPGEHVEVACTYCGAPGSVARHGAWVTLGDLAIDHVRPVRHGGSNDVKNLTLACRRCNASKGAYTVQAWIERLQNSKYQQYANLPAILERWGA